MQSKIFREIWIHYYYFKYALLFKTLKKENFCSFEKNLIQFENI